MRHILNILLIAAGTTCVALGVLGIFLPVLPTTPFLLLAAFCYARSSRRFYNWLISNRWCGEYIRNYREGRGITRRHRRWTLAFLWTAIGCSAVAVTIWWVRLLLGAVAMGVTIHLLMLKTCTPSAEGTKGRP